MAYGAIAALQDQAFVLGVRTHAADPERRRTLAYEILKDPSYVLSLPNTAGAAGMVIAALGTDGSQLMTTGLAVKQAAYDVQRSAWSKSEIPNRDMRLAGAKSLSITPRTGEVSETLRLQQATSGAAPIALAPQTASPPYTPFVVRSIALAALAALGYAGDDFQAHTSAVLADPASSSCLTMSKLNLYQCLAVAKPHYEDVFCLGQHALIDTGRCMARGVGASEPVDPRVRPLTVAGPVIAQPAPGLVSTPAPTAPKP
ncbi:MAG TPA: hypothetical protein VIO94_04810, partial [Phenylobacterium sp.]